MKLLSHKKTRELVDEMRQAAGSGPKTWDPWLDENNGPAVLYLAAGELFNGSVAGFVWAWKLQEKIGYLLPSEADKINGLRRQGLEGIVQIETDLCIALQAYDAVPEYRARVATERDS